MYSGTFKTTDTTRTLTIPCWQEDVRKQRTGTGGPCQNLAFFNDCLEKQTVLVEDQYLWMHLHCDRGKPSQFTKNSRYKRSGRFFWVTSRDARTEYVAGPHGRTLSLLELSDSLEIGRSDDYPTTGGTHTLE